MLTPEKQWLVPAIYALIYRDSREKEIEKGEIDRGQIATWRMWKRDTCMVSSGEQPREGAYILLQCISAHNLNENLDLFV